MTQIESITKGKVRLINDFPFFGSLLMRYPAEEVDETLCPTMATDGRIVIYNSKFTNSLDADEVAAVLGHEACHIAFLHPLRRNNRDPKLWNVACDFVVNPILRDAGMKLPADHLYDEKYAGQTAEHVYDMLMQDIQNGKLKVVFKDGSSMGKEKGKGGGGKTIKAQGWGEVNDAEGMSEEDKRREEIETGIRVLQAAHTAKQRGKLPSAFNGLIDKFLESKVNWKERIRTFIGGNKPDDYSYRRPNKKHMALSSVYLPSIEYTGAGCIVIGVDASGSVSDREMAQFLGEIKAIHAEMRPDSLHLVWVDTQIQHVAHYGPHDEFDDKQRYACGGTYLRPAFEWVEKNGIEPNSFIFLTDLEIGNEMDDLSPNYPVLWVSTSQTRAPFGEVIKINVD